MLLSGFGVAGSVLGAVVAAFALASAVVAFSVWPSDSASGDLEPLTLAPAEVAQGSRDRDRPIVLPSPGGGPATAAAAAPSGAGARRSSGSARSRRAGQRATAGRSTGYDAGAPNADTTISARPADSGPSPGAAGKEAPLAKVGGTVDNTTRSLSKGVGDLTSDLGNGLKPLSPELGAAVVKTGETLAKTVENLGAALAALLGYTKPSPPPR